MHCLTLLTAADADDRALRSWFMRAMANVGKLVMSLPYIDFSSGTTVMTLCRTISSQQDRSRPLAVMCVDLSLDTFREVIRSQTNCSLSRGHFNGLCMIVNDNGYLLWHPELLVRAQNSSASDASLAVHVGDLYPAVGVVCSSWRVAGLLFLCCGRCCQGGVVVVVFAVVVVVVVAAAAAAAAVAVVVVGGGGIVVVVVVVGGGGGGGGGGIGMPTCLHECAGGIGSATRRHDAPVRRPRCQQAAQPSLPPPP
jgi:hypothetical protein